MTNLFFVLILYFPSHFHSFISSAHTLCSLDVSGNIALGNTGALQLLNACHSRLKVRAAREGKSKIEGQCLQMSLNLVACGIESPLPNTLIRAVVQLKEEGENKSSWTFKLDLFGNLIDKGDMSLISLS